MLRPELRQHRRVGRPEPERRPIARRRVEQAFEHLRLGPWANRCVALRVARSNTPSGSLAHLPQTGDDEA